MSHKETKVGASWLPETVSKGDLAVMLGLNPRTVSDWTTKGVLKPAAQRGRYLTLPSIHAYCEHLRERSANRITESGLSLSDERARNERVNREISEMKLAQMKGEVLTLAEVSEAWSTLALSVKVNVMSLPSKARQTIPHLTAHDAQQLKALCRDVLTTMADDVEAGVIGAVVDDDGL